jgi:low temperature requirement protein LtrA
LTVWTRLHWIGVSTLLALCFLQIDQAYRTTGLRLSDAGYVTALLAMVMALPLTAGALMHARRPTRGMEITCFVAATVLVLVAVFHALGVWRAGLPWLQGVQLIVPWILAIALGIRRVAPASPAA